MKVVEDGWSSELSSMAGLIEGPVFRIAGSVRRTRRALIPFVVNRVKALGRYWCPCGHVISHSHINCKYVLGRESRGTLPPEPAEAVPSGLLGASGVSDISEVHFAAHSSRVIPALENHGGLRGL